MERVCFKLQVKPDRLAEYKQRHREVWPEMLTALRNSGWLNYSLFLDDGGMLIGYFETDNLQQALASIAKEEVNLRWQREMAGFFIGLPGARADQGFLRLEQVFYTA